MLKDYILWWKWRRWEWKRKKDRKWKSKWSIKGIFKEAEKELIHIKCNDENVDYEHKET